MIPPVGGSLDLNRAKVFFAAKKSFFRVDDHSAFFEYRFFDNIPICLSPISNTVGFCFVV